MATPITLEQRVAIRRACNTPSAKAQAEWFIHADDTRADDAQEYAGNPDLVAALDGQDAYSWLESRS